MTATALHNPAAFGRASSSSRGAWHTIRLWQQRARQRARLAELSPELLEDIGLSARAADTEAGKPFWVG